MSHQRRYRSHKVSQIIGTCTVSSTDCSCNGKDTIQTHYHWRTVAPVRVQSRGKRAHAMMSLWLKPSPCDVRSQVIKRRYPSSKYSTVWRTWLEHDRIRHNAISIFVIQNTIQRGIALVVYYIAIAIWSISKLSCFCCDMLIAVMCLICFMLWHLLIHAAENDYRGNILKWSMKC